MCIYYIYIRNVYTDKTDVMDYGRIILAEIFYLRKMMFNFLRSTFLHNLRTVQESTSYTLNKSI